MSNNYKYIQVDINNYILSIILNRPSKKNALNQKMVTEINSALDLHKESMNVRVVLLSSNCDVFCAGADLAYLQQIKDFNHQENLQDSKQMMTLFKNMLLYPKLIISKISGAAIAGGCGLMTASDITFATHESSFGYPEVKIGFVPALVSTFLIAKISETKTRELLLTGKKINAKTAKKIGLINHLCTKENIDKKVTQFIHKFIKTTSPNSIARTKNIIYNSLDLDSKLEKAAELNAITRTDKDFKKGLDAFLNKKPINWREI